MRRLRFKEVFLLLPLLFVWILFQVSHYKKRHINLHETAGNSFTLKSLNSINSTGHKFGNKDPFASKLNWMPPPEVLEKNYDDDFHEFLKTVGDKGKNSPPKKLWFMRGGSIRPEEITINLQNKLWPEQNAGDRIVEQLMYSPKNYSSEWSVPSPLVKFRLYDSHKNDLKKILLIGDFARNKMPPGRSVFWQDKCPVNTCTFVTTLEEARSTDVVIFKGKYLKGIDLLVRRKPNHVWVLYLPEPPLNSDLGSLRNVINWTASYRHDSDIVTPYRKFVPYNITSLYSPRKTGLPKIYGKNYAANKTKKVAWFVSNCDSKDVRLQYAKNLSRYIEVDMYGSCGTKRCPYILRNKCIELLEVDYKFYLSFEKRNCKEYITDIFFEYGLSQDILPIVMGPPREDYDRIAPPYSFIHVDDFATPKDLADYLHILDAHDALYNEYFDWKSTGELIDTRFWCRLCAMLHSPRERRSYEDVQKWWSGPGVCET